MNQKEFLIAISEALEVDPDNININLKLGDLEKWDSLGHLTILFTLDSLTGEKASEIKDFGSLGSLQDIWDALVNAGLAA